MAVTKSTYTQGAGQLHQDVAITPATLADGTLHQRFDRKAFPQKGVKYSGTHGAGDAVAIPKAAKKTHGSGS